MKAKTFTVSFTICSLFIIVGKERTLGEWNAYYNERFVKLVNKEQEKFTKKKDDIYKGLMENIHMTASKKTDQETVEGTAN